MPREDVPYPTGAICSIRERIAELRDELDQLLKTVNGVAGDANHDIKLISDNSALGITNDAVQHEIHLDLDTSQLPAALVDSVNGQTGTVVLDGDDLDGVTPGNSVNDDIAALQSADVTLQGNINAEATARANGDSSLATAINAALATIPGEVSSQIANNAAIIQLQNDVLAIPNKVDKRTGAGKFAYTHDGGTQGDIALVDGTTAATIPIRDANGRMQAADPASGATDKTLTTANWVSQTGDSSPNNLIHRSGNESKNGNLTLLKPLFITRPDNGQCYIQTTDLGFDLMTLPGSTVTRLIIDTYDKNSKRFLSLYEGTRNNGSKLMNFTIRNYDTDGNANGQASLILNLNADGTCELRMQDGLGNNIQVAHT